MFNNNALPNIPKDLHPLIWPSLDYKAASRMRETSNENRVLSDHFFPEMQIWQKRSWKIIELTQKIAISNQQLEIQFPRKNQNDLSSNKGFLIDSKIYKINCTISNLNDKKKSLSKIIKEHRALVNLGDNKPFFRLLGKAKGIMNLQEKILDIQTSIYKKNLNYTDLSPKDLQQHIMKGIDKERGSIYIFIRDQFMSYYVIGIKEWKNNYIHQVNLHEVYLNTTSFSQQISASAKIQKSFLRIELLPLWTLQQITSHKIINEIEFCFGSSIHSVSLLTLEQTIKRNIAFNSN